MSRIHAIRVGTALAAFGAILFVAWAIEQTRAGGSIDPSREVGLTQSEAAQVVAAFVGLPSMTADLTVRGPDDGAIDVLYTVEGAHVSATVDANDGHVVGIVFLDQTPMIDDIRVNEDEAVDAAAMFLDAHRIPGITAKPAVEYVSHGETHEYVVTWQESVHSVLVPNKRVLGVDAATGKVFRFLDVRHPFVDPGEPKLEKAEAAALALKAAEITDAQVDDAQVWLRFDLAGRQYLAWVVQVSSPDLSTDGDTRIQVHAVIEVNDETRTAIVVGRG